MTTEKCIICDVDTKIEKSTHIDYRYFYVEGVGQLCKECWEKISSKEKLEYYEE
jgi:recombinational DNA repair protein (RecF pathway)